MKTWVLTLGLGAALGAIAILMMPRDNPTRKLAAQAANKMENAVSRLGSEWNLDETSN